MPADADAKAGNALELRKPRAASAAVAAVALSRALSAAPLNPLRAVEAPLGGSGRGARSPSECARLRTGALPLRLPLPVAASPAPSLSPPPPAPTPTRMPRDVTGSGGSGGGSDSIGGAGGRAGSHDSESRKYHGRTAAARRTVTTATSGCSAPAVPSWLCASTKSSPSPPPPPTAAPVALLPAPLVRRLPRLRMPGPRRLNAPAVPTPIAAAPRLPARGGGDAAAPGGSGSSILTVCSAVRAASDSTALPRGSPSSRA